MLNKILIFLLFISSTLSAQIMDNFTLQQHWNTPRESAKKMTESLTLDEKIGQMLMVDFRHWGTLPHLKEKVTQPNPEILEIVHRYHFGSVVFFRENLVTTEQVVNLINGFQSARSNLPLFIGIDQEGGYVTRLQEGTEMPGNMALGATRSTELANRAGDIHGKELAALGFNFNFGPVVDINNNQENPVINVRSYSDHPELVIELANAYIDGIHQHQIMTSLKHFPGHGNVSTDTHFALPSINIDEQTWRALELLPFMALKEKSDAIMTAHIVVPALDNNPIISSSSKKIGTPATLSKPILTGILRDELNYQGLIITDAMDMGAIANYFDSHWAIKEAILAGNDIILMPISITSKNDVEKLDALYNYLKEEARHDPELMKRIDESVARIIEKKLEKKITAEPKEALTAKQIVASKFNKEQEQLIADQAVTLIKNDDNVLPYELKNNNKILVLSDEFTRNELINNLLMGIGKEKQIQMNVSSQVVKMMGHNLNDQQIDSLISEQDLIILVTYNLTRSPINAQKIIDHANKKNVPIVVISSRNPYDIAYLNHVKANIAIYGITGFDITNNVRNSLEANIRSGINTLLSYEGQPLNSPVGKLPVNIKDETNQYVLFPYGFGLTY